MFLRSLPPLSTLLLAASLACCQKADTAGQEQHLPPLNVSVMNMQQQDVDLISTWFGHLRGVEQADIRPEVSGKLLHRVYADGSLVQKGDVLFEIDPSSYQAAVDQCAAALAAAEAAVLQARATDDRAGQDTERYGKLVSSGSVSEKNYTDALQTKKETEAALAAARAQVKQAQAALSNARINLDRCTIRAPFTGLASKSTVSVGDLIALANPTALCTMSSVDPIRVDFAVPGKQLLGKVFRPDFNTLTQTSPIDEFDIILADGQVYAHRGHVAAVDSEVSRSTGTINFIGHVPNPQLKLRSGSAVRVRAKTDTVKDAVLVPSRALISAMNHRYVLVVNPADNTPICLDVQPGAELTLPMPNGDGNTVPMLMQVITGTVKPLPELLREHGIERVSDAQVIVEGGQMAARYAKINGGIAAAAAQAPEGARSAILAKRGTVVPEPFVYTPPVSTTPSVTAKQN